MHTRFIATTTIVVAAIASCAAFSSPAQARTHQHRYQHHRHHHADHHQTRHVRMAGHWRGHRHHSHGHRGPAGNSTDLASVSGTLAAKAREIVASCGSKVISSFRPGARIAGSGHASMHASGRAVDIRGNHPASTGTCRVGGADIRSITLLCSMCISRSEGTRMGCGSPTTRVTFATVDTDTRPAPNEKN